MTFLTLASSALTLGFLHGLGADHLMAIAALGIDGRTGVARRRRVVAAAVQFAAGHALLLGIGATLAVTLGWVLPAAVSSGAERVGGALLVLLGAAGLWSVSSGRAYGHVHAVRTSAPRWHVHLGRPGAHGEAQHHTTVLPVLMGAVFAVSSLRMLMLLTPFGGEAGALALPVLFVLIAFFGVGILLSMSLFGVLLARVLSLGAIERLGRSAGALVAAASMALGVYWMSA